MTKYKNAVCRGCWQLGNNCKTCERCIETNPNDPSMGDESEAEGYYLRWARGRAMFSSDHVRVLKEAFLAGLRRGREKAIQEGEMLLQRVEKREVTAAVKEERERCVAKIAQMMGYPEEKAAWARLLSPEEGER